MGKQIEEEKKGSSFGAGFSMAKKPEAPQIKEESKSSFGGGGGSFGGFSMKKNGPPAGGSSFGGGGGSFGGFKMGAGAGLQEKKPESSIDLFLKCFDDVVHKRV